MNSCSKVSLAHKCCFLILHFGCTMQAFRLSEDCSQAQDLLPRVVEEMVPVDNVNEADLIWGPAVSGYRIAVAVNQRTVRAMDRIEIRVFLKNESANVLRYGDPKLALGGFKCDVLLPPKANEPPQIAPLTLFGKHAVSPLNSMGVASVDILPGTWHSRRVYEPLNRIYDMSVSGEYSIVVKYSVPIQGRDPVEVVSEKLVITVRP